MISIIIDKTNATEDELHAFDRIPEVSGFVATLMRTGFKEGLRITIKDTVTLRNTADGLMCVTGAGDD